MEEMDIIFDDCPEVSEVLLVFALEKPVSVDHLSPVKEF
jgi:hypothetical protein